MKKLWLYVELFFLVAVVVILTAFIVRNAQTRVRVHFIFFEKETSALVLTLISMVLGAALARVGGWLWRLRKR